MTENAGVAIEGEGQGVVTLNPELHKQAQEEKARSKGWKPLSEYQGEPADWIDAGEFLGREKLYNTIHDLRRQNSKLEKDIGVITKHFSSMEERAYERALADLKEKQAVAVEEQDVAAVSKVTEEIANLKAKHVVDKANETSRQSQSGESPEFVEWREQNAWFEQDRDMREDAIAIGIGYAAKNVNMPQKEVLEYVSEKIKKIYPDKFQKKSQTRKEPIVESGDGTPAAKDAPGTKKGKKLTVNDLDERELSTMKTFLKRGVFKDAAKKRNISEQDVYLEDLAKAKGI